MFAYSVRGSSPSEDCVGVLLNATKDLVTPKIIAIF